MTIMMEASYNPVTGEVLGLALLRESTETGLIPTFRLGTSALRVLAYCAEYQAKRANL